MAFLNDQVSELETKKIIYLAKEALKIAGDFVEMGCYRGDTSLALAEILKDSAKKLWIYDSFEGLPRKREEDESVLGSNFRAGELSVTKREVKIRFLRSGLPVPIITKGWFSDLKKEDFPEQIAFAFLDSDFYESIRDSLKLVIPQMVSGGILVVHDYTNPALPGVKKAVDEFEDQLRNLKLVLL